MSDATPIEVSQTPEIDASAELRRAATAGPAAGGTRAAVASSPRSTRPAT
ncbi:MAG TPA: hypothetical protein VF212_16360 [Longimicrobiales bacterium]